MASNSPGYAQQQSLFQSVPPQIPLDDILKSIPDLIFVIDREGRYLAVSGELGALITPVDKNLGSTVIEDLGPELGGLVMAKANQAIKTGKLVLFESNAEKDGQPVYMETRITPLSEGRTLHIVRIVTQLKLAERALAVQGARQAKILNSLPDLVIILDEAGYYREFWGNLDLFMFPAEQALNRHFDELLPPWVANAYREDLAIARASGQTVVRERQMMGGKELRDFEIRITYV